MEKENITEQPRIKKESLLKKVLLAGGETANIMKLNYLLGAGFGIAGRATGEGWLPIIPPAMDYLSFGALSDGKILGYFAYGAGVATAWADKIYEHSKPFLD